MQLDQEKQRTVNHQPLQNAVYVIFSKTVRTGTLSCFPLPPCLPACLPRCSLTFTHLMSVSVPKNYMTDKRNMHMHMH